MQTIRITLAPLTTTRKWNQFIITSTTTIIIIIITIMIYIIFRYVKKYQTIFQTNVANIPLVSFSSTINLYLTCLWYNYVWSLLRTSAFDISHSWLLYDEYLTNTLSPEDSG